MQKARRDAAITAFTQHGFVHDGTSGEQAYGTCPFCGKKGHFYVNRKSHNWDCKSCGKKGGYQTWLREIVELSKINFKGDPAIKLSKDRNVSLGTLRDMGVGFNPINRTVILPVLDIKGEKIWDIRIRVGKGLRSTSGCKVGLYGWDKVDKPEIKTIWICEGEWDGLVMMEIIEKMELGDHAVVAVPGAGTFKADWITLFERKKVNVVYDHDNPGREGCKKVYNALSQVVERLRFVQWPDEEKDGWDLRDQFSRMKKNHRRTYAYIKVLLGETPPGIDDIEEADFGSDVQISKGDLDGEGLEATEVYAEYRKWLKLPATNIIDVMFGTAIANRLPGDPLWLFIVAPSGGTKTELLMSLTTAHNMVTTTTLTPPALISGANMAGGSDPSLLRIMNGRILLIKDFTTILSMNSMVREEIFGILRDAYDGRIEKRFGNGVYRRYDPCRFGIVAGVTPAIELFTEEHTALGERFLRYKVPLSANWDDQRDILRRAVLNTTHEDKMREDLQKVGQTVLNHNFNLTPNIPDHIIDRILCLAQWTALMRATIVRDRFTKEVTHKPISELGTRLAKQFCKLLLGIGMFRRITTVTDEEYQIVKDIAVGTVPSRMEDIVRMMYTRNKTGNYDPKEIAEVTGLPQMTTSRIIENLGMLGIFRKEKISALKTQWRLSDDILSIMERAEIY